MSLEVIRQPRFLALAVGFVALLVALFNPAAAAAEEPQPGAIGYDVSFPQCGARLPRDGSFGIVGVNAGLPWSENPCFASQFRWAQSRGDAAIYMNTANPAPHSDYYWSAAGASDPALCSDNKSTSDPGCAYNYGWHAAEHALDVAIKAVGSEAVKVEWWLDVEEANSWNGDGYSNAADIQGSIDYLRSEGVPRVGVYSTPAQWRAITGGYSRTSASEYAAKWDGSFSPKVPLDEVRNWIAGAVSKRQAQANCASTLTGVPAYLSQYSAKGFDANLVCGTALRR